MDRSLPRSRRSPVTFALAIAAIAVLAACGGDSESEPESESGGDSYIYEVPAFAMQPTYGAGDKVEIDRENTSPEIGDVALFNPPDGAISNACAARPERGAACPESTPQLADTEFLMRVVAVGGDSVAIDGGVPIVDGEPVEGDWEIEECRTGKEGACDLPKAIAVPPDQYFMLGDNRGESNDSRFWGPVPQDAIVGVAAD